MENTEKYQMSPFGDQRWDWEEEERMRRKKRHDANFYINTKTSKELDSSKECHLGGKQEGNWPNQMSPFSLERWEMEDKMRLAKKQEPNFYISTKLNAEEPKYQMSPFSDERWDWDEKEKHARKKMTEAFDTPVIPANILEVTTGNKEEESAEGPSIELPKELYLRKPFEEPFPPFLYPTISLTKYTRAKPEPPNLVFMPVVKTVISGNAGDSDYQPSFPKMHGMQNIANVQPMHRGIPVPLWPCP